MQEADVVLEPLQRAGMWGFHVRGVLDFFQGGGGLGGLSGSCGSSPSGVNSVLSELLSKSLILEKDH